MKSIIKPIFGRPEDAWSDRLGGHVLVIFGGSTDEVSITTEAFLDKGDWWSELSWVQPVGKGVILADQRSAKQWNRPCIDHVDLSNNIGAKRKSSIDQGANPMNIDGRIVGPSDKVY